jgi:hypothetical protein
MKIRREFFVLAAALLLAAPAWADDAPALPGPGFDGDHYADLWTKSPFAIATADAPPTSQDYELVGMAQFDGISYVSLVEKESSKHFTLTSEKPVDNIKLVSISHGPNGASAVILRNGESLTLQEEQAPAQPASMPMILAGQTGTSYFMRPSPNPSVGGMVPANLPPRAHFHRPLIHIPLPPPSR